LLAAEWDTKTLIITIITKAKSIQENLKAYLDLTRAHFFPVWPIIFCSGLMLAFANYGGFSWSLTMKKFL
jgi:4-hydroxybenzoate polyprenyltransferase